MASLILNTHYKYDSTYRYYYLTPVGVELLTGIDSLDNDWKDCERRLKRQGKLLKTTMSLSSSLEKRQRYTREDYIEYITYKNENGELNAILFMLGEMAEWAYDVDGDLMVYEERDPFDVYKFLPITIKAKGRNTGLIFLGRTEYYIPEDEYQVGY